MSRRRFLHQSLTVAALSCAAGRSLATVSGGTPSASRDTARLAAIAQVLYPHASLPGEVYAAVAASLLAQASADPVFRRLLETGFAELDRAGGGDWLSLAAPARLSSLKERQSTEFFQRLRASTAFALYSNPEVWKRFGYGGDAWSLGGYDRKALNDIDWLPEPAESM